jgi:copper chaperone CopZ
MQTMELKVRMDCEGCKLKVKNAISSLKGSTSVSALLTRIDKPS